MFPADDLVEVRFDDGRTLLAAALLGADGVHSVVRERLLGDGSPHYCGYTSVRGEAVAPGGLPYGFVAADSGTHLFAASVGPGQLYWAAKLDAAPGVWPAKAPAVAVPSCSGFLPGGTRGSSVLFVRQGHWWSPMFSIGIQCRGGVLVG
jgi:hypothetical protein